MNRLTHACLICVLALLFSLATSFKVNAGQSVLLGLAQELHCATSERQAVQVLKKLSALSLKPFGIPSENPYDGRNAELYAATVDVLLQMLYDVIQRFPSLQDQAERIALLWNYCDIVNDGDLADLVALQKGDIEKSEAIGPFPANKQGFSVWGLIKKKAGNRYTPKILTSTPLYPNAFQDLFHRLTQELCFPDPEDFNKTTDNRPYYGALHLAEVLKPGKKYPYTWGGQPCLPVPTNKVNQKPVKPAPIKLAPEKQEKPVIEVPQAITEAAPVIVEIPVELPKKPKQKPEKTVQKTKRPKKKKSIIMEIITKEYTVPVNDETPIISPAIPSGNSNIGAALPLPPANGLGIAGNFYHRAKLTGQMSFGANGSWKPYSYFFVRGGVNYNYLPGSGTFSYSWGLGYDDWHQGTFSAQINNWGPIEPGKKSLFDGTVANLGYKFVADFLKPYHLSGSASLNLPFSGDPSISTSWVWSPIDHWFVRASLSKSLTSSGGLDWSYSFGYSDWHPFTFSLTYDNWGTNPIFDSSQSNSFNFTENGAISLSWGWAF